MMDPVLELVIGTSTKTRNLTPGSINLYDNLDARTALSFQLRMPTSDTRPVVGQPVYLCAGTSNDYIQIPDFYNRNFEVGSGTVTTAGYVIIGAASYYWRGYIQNDFGNQIGYSTVYPIYGGNKYMQIYISATSSDPFAVFFYNEKGMYSSNNIPIKQNTVYNIDVDYQVSGVTSSDNGGAYFYVYTGATYPFPNVVAYKSTFGTLTTHWSTSFTNTTDPYLDMRFQIYKAQGSLIIDNIEITEQTPHYIFGGTLDNYNETLLNPLGGSSGLYLVLNCNCVDFSQLVGKRRVYKSYVSSGLGEYDSVATTDNFTGDGVTRTWGLSYPVQTTPTVTINGFAASVAPVGSASTFGYYYTLSSNFLLANTSNNAPASTDTVSVVYTAIVGKAAYDSDIIADINTNFFNGEGITIGDYVSTGIRINELNYNYVPGNEALNTICDITGRTWYVDPWKRLHYFARTENPAPFNINSTSDNWRSCTVKRSRDKYRNKEYVLNSFGLLLSTESFNGDGQSRTFTVALPVYSQPLVKVNGYTATVGIANVSASTYGYYWSKETRQIYSNSSNLALASTDTLTVEYTGLYPVVTVSADGDEISTRAQIESNSGIYEEIATANKTYALDAALDYGAAIIAKYGKPLDEVTLETDIDGLQAGHLISINLPNSDLDGDYLITSVTGRDVGMATMRYKVNACSGLDRGGWASFFRSLVTGITPIYTEPFENLAQLKQATVLGNIKFTDTIDITRTTITIAYYDTAVYDTGVYT
jgi:hypothetical protein